MQRFPFAPAPLALAVALALGGMATAVHAAEPTVSAQVRNINIPAQPLAQALNSTLSDSASL